MADQGQVATTGIDSLISYLKEHGETDSVSLAIALKVGEAIIEEWANALERANLLKISYRMGKMYLSVENLKPEQVESTKKTIENKQKVLLEDVTSQLQFIKNIDERVAALGSIISSGEEAFKKSWGNIKKELDMLGEVEKKSDIAYKKILERKEHINTSMQALDKEMKALEEIAKRVKDFDASTPEIDRIIADMRNRIAFINSSIEELPKKFKKIVDDEGAMLNDFIAKSKESIRIIERVVNEQERMLDEREAEIYRYKRDASRISSELSRERSKILDEASVAAREIEALANIAEEKRTKLKGDVTAIKDKFGDAATLDKTLNELKEELTKINEEKESLRKELEGVRAAIEAIHILDSGDIYAKGMDVERYEEKSKETNTKLSALGKKIKELDDKIKKGGGK